MPQATFAGKLRYGDGLFTGGSKTPQEWLQFVRKNEGFEDFAGE
jgi:hypothetical protein